MVHHNAYFPDDVASLVKGMDENARLFPNKIFEVQRAISENDIVAVHSKFQMNVDEPFYSVMHIFRFQNGKIAEMWDFAQMVPENSPNKNGMF